MLHQKMSLYKKTYPQVNHQVVIRNTRLGTYLLSGNSILEIDDLGKEIVRQCDGCHTVQEIAQWIAEREESEEIHKGMYKDIYGELNQFLDTLFKEGIIEYRDCPETLDFDPIYSYDRPLSVIWEITYACNQNCVYCIAEAGTPAPHELSKEEISSVLDELIELRVGLINITGGEPLLKKDTALYIARRASENGIDLELLTNGMLVTPEVAEQFYEAGVCYAQVSLDCARPEVHDAQRGVRGAWRKAVEGISNLRNAGIEVMAAAVMNSKNIKYFEETAQFLGEIADTVKMAPVIPMGRGENNTYLLTAEMYCNLLELKGKTQENQLTAFIFCKEKCSIGTTPVIAPDGDVYPCMLAKYQELKLGNVRKTSIGDIYEHSDLLHELFACTVEKIEPCSTCWNRYYCGGGCRGCAFQYYRTIYRNDPYQCEARKKFAREVLKRGHPVTRKALQEVLLVTTSSRRLPND